jgi:hypothetical protein
MCTRLPPLHYPHHARLQQEFAELQTVGQVHLWMRQERSPMPATEYGPEGGKVIWKLPVSNTPRGVAGQFMGIPPDILG